MQLTSQELIVAVYEMKGYAAVEPILVKLPQHKLIPFVSKIPEIGPFIENMPQETPKKSRSRSVKRVRNQLGQRSKEKEKPIPCQFCGEESIDFNNNEKIDLHYVLHCSMLTNCVACTQIIEVSSYTQHKLDECEKKADFKKCNRCLEAIELDFFEQHDTA
jgi:hypothetical protein